MPLHGSEDNSIPINTSSFLRNDAAVEKLLYFGKRRLIGADANSPRQPDTEVGTFTHKPSV